MNLLSIDFANHFENQKGIMAQVFEGFDDDFRHVSLIGIVCLADWVDQTDMVPADRAAACSALANGRSCVIEHRNGTWRALAPMTIGARAMSLDVEAILALKRQPLEAG